jgi:flagellar motility protein MotE (MotC chaperone)
MRRRRIGAVYPIGAGCRVTLDFATLDTLRTHHPAWRLLRSDHAPLVASFLHRVFVAPNVRVMAAADLTEALEDELYALRLQLGDKGESAFPKPAMDYLNDWAAPDKGWLRKFYRPGTDEAQFDLTPATERAIAWLAQLSERQFVGTESRLLTLFDLLKQMSEGSEADPAKRIAELHKKRDDIDAEIARVLSGDVPLLDDTALKDRFLQFMQGARELLTDFREVEHNFRQLDRRVRERIALWEGSKGALLEDIMGERDAIADSDQGKSFRAFWDFLLSSRRQEELTELLERVLALPAVTDLKPDSRTRRVHYDWMEAGEHTQRTVAALSQQLRRFLDDQAWLENRRIMDILHGIESKALALRDAPPAGIVMAMAEACADSELAMERPLFTPAIKPVIADLALQAGDEDIDPAALFDQVVVDEARLTRHLRHALQDRAQITLSELVASQPLLQGLAELVAYLQLGSGAFSTVVDEDTPEPIRWQTVATDGQAITRSARLPRVIFMR